MSVELEFVMVGKMFIALILGAIIGIERQKSGSSAGLRTHSLVCMGSALFTVISLDFLGVADVTRIAAGIVMGIGFLGAGSIFRAEDRVKGLTTAADYGLLQELV